MLGTAVNNSPDGAGQKTATFAPLLPGRLRLASTHPKAFGCWLLQARGSAHFWHSIPGNCLVWLIREMEKAFWVVMDKQHAKSFYHCRWESFISPPISLGTLGIILQLKEKESFARQWIETVHILFVLLFTECQYKALAPLCSWLSSVICRAQTHNLLKFNCRTHE